eukprot:5468545-Amphidinium_carterae.1
MGVNGTTNEGTVGIACRAQWKDLRKRFENRAGLQKKVGRIVSKLNIAHATGADITRTKVATNRALDQSCMHVLTSVSFCRVYCK